MSVATPETMEEWLQYVAILTEDELYSKAIAANTQKFLGMLLEDGFTPQEVKSLMQGFARKFVDFNMQPPAGLFDLETLGATAPSLPDPATIEWEPEPDNIDRFVEEMDLETDWDEVGALENANLT